MREFKCKLKLISIEEINRKYSLLNYIGVDFLSCGRKTLNYVDELLFFAYKKFNNYKKFRYFLKHIDYILWKLLWTFCFAKGRPRLQFCQHLLFNF